MTKTTNQMTYRYVTQASETIEFIARLTDSAKTTNQETTMRFSATIEYLPGQRAAIIELTDSRGEWAGGGRIDIRSSLRSDLYEEGYRHASRAAAVKGGVLDRFSEVSQ